MIVLSSAVLEFKILIAQILMQSKGIDRLFL